MDATQAVLTTIYDSLTSDAELNEIIEGRVHHKPLADTVWPYVTHKLDTLSDTQRATRPATYTLHAWDRSTNTDRVWRIREAVMRILDNARLDAPSMGVVRLWHATDAWIPDEDAEIVHLVLAFEARYARAAEVRRIMTQKGL